MHSGCKFYHETETESEIAFFTKPAETDRLQDFENRNNTSCSSSILNPFVYFIGHASTV